jgi:hypothetical protein
MEMPSWCRLRVLDLAFFSQATRLSSAMSTRRYIRQVSGDGSFISAAQEKRWRGSCARRVVWCCKQPRRCTTSCRGRRSLEGKIRTHPPRSRPFGTTFTHESISSRVQTQRKILLLPVSAMLRAARASAHDASQAFESINTSTLLALVCASRRVKSLIVFVAFFRSPEWRS